MKSTNAMSPREEGMTGTERGIHFVLAGLLFTTVIRSRSTLVRTIMSAAGGAVLFQGLRGERPIYELLGLTGPRTQDRIFVTKRVTIARPPDEVYRFFRDFENLPRFMGHLESVETIDSRRSHWQARAPLGMTVEWDAELTRDTPNEVIGWRSLPDADVDNRGTVRFERGAQGDSTELTVELEYLPPAGKLGATIAKLLGEEPDTQMDEDLQRLKQMLESSDAGAIPTIGSTPSARPKTQGPPQAGL